MHKGLAILLRGRKREYRFAKLEKDAQWYNERASLLKKSCNVKTSLTIELAFTPATSHNNFAQALADIFVFFKTNYVSLLATAMTDLNSTLLQV
ncbi:4191_t:CDS:2 [Funneliformis mosseae]|uniref:4191_t:CDS:1 n=1 Tax=Funneliformis mosseae TaxID=27381 RepID=A0A9N9HF47_FUNMO|nr:4191_t:CDS:2 [Funneliformis mosseae]